MSISKIIKELDEEDIIDHDTKLEDIDNSDDDDPDESDIDDPDDDESFSKRWYGE